MPPAEPAPEPKKRGRPRKHPIASPADPSAVAAARKRGRPPNPDAAARRASKAAAAAATRADASGGLLSKRPVGRPRKNANAQNLAGLGPPDSPAPIAQLVHPSSAHRAGLDDPVAAPAEPDSRALQARKKPSQARVASASGTPSKRRRLAPKRTGTGTPQHLPSASAARPDVLADALAAGETDSDDFRLDAEDRRGLAVRASSSLLDHRVATNVDYMGADEAREEPQMDAVVKVFCTHTEPNYSLPWQRKRQSASTSSGFIIDGRRVLTNAHSVEHHTQVKLKKRGDDKKYVARVLAIGVECDLALLTVNDASFFDGVAPVRFGRLPSLQDSVTVVGYPIGGVAISVTSGVVSRIEVTAYSHGSSELLGLQIDAAINSGNSGGPAFNARGECVGVAFQSLKHDDAENIGYVIPSPVIVHFLRDYARNGRYTGFPTLGLEWQKLENPDMRKYLKVLEATASSGAPGVSGDGGVYVRRVAPTAAIGELIKPRDVLLRFDDVPIANDGTVPFRAGERISFHYLVSEKYVGERATITYARNGETRVAALRLASTPRLVPVHINGAPPTYLIVAGLVFTVVCVPFLKSEYGKEYDYDAPVKLLDRMMHDHAAEKGQNVVVLSQVLASDANIGYEDIVNTAVLGFNGTKVRDLKQLAQMVEACTDEFLRFELEHELLVVLKRAAAHKATRDVLETHCIPEAKSADLR